jgi:glycerol dehydrogenase
VGLKILLAPGRYVQGPKALREIGNQLRAIGVQNPLILASRSGIREAKDDVSRSLDAAGISYAWTGFNGECTWEEIRRVKELCLEGGHDGIVNIGGGKCIDTGRAAACKNCRRSDVVPAVPMPDFGAGVPCINVPTIAATDATTSTGCLVYTEPQPPGVIEASLTVSFNPALVFVDTELIARAPYRFLACGMGDALATYFEADSSFRTNTPALLTGGASLKTTQALAKLCLEILLEHGREARIECEAGIAGPGVEAIVEANVLLSGLGFESGGLGAGHAFGECAYHLSGKFERFQYHGEVVAFGTLCHLMLEVEAGRSMEFIDEIYAFCRAVGLPTTFEELTLKGLTDADLDKWADLVSRDFEMQSFPGATLAPDAEGRFFADVPRILNALKAADAHGRAFAAGGT